MICLKGILNNKVISSIKNMLAKIPSLSSLVIHEKDGTCIFAIVNSSLCKYINNISLKNPVETINSSKCWLLSSCYKNYYDISKKVIEKKIPFKRKCFSGITIVSIPIFYNNNVVGCISAGVSMPSLSSKKIDQISKKFNLDSKKLIQKAKSHKKIYQKYKNISEPFLEIIVSLLSSLYAFEMYRLKEESLINTSHELRTPLTVILGAIQTISNLDCSDPKNQPIDNKIQKYLYMIRQNCYRLLRLINNLLDTKCIESGYIDLRFQNLDIVGVLIDIITSVSDLTASKNVKINFRTDVKRKVMAIDIDKIERIVLNLLSNAIKFTPEGNEITVSLIDKGNRIEMRVKDTGIGIPNDKINNIFERFKKVDNKFSKENQGSGIGLSLVKSLVDLHGGTICVNSKVGKGTEFIINLPSFTLNESQNKPTPYSTTLDNIIKTANIELSDLYFPIN